ncbi:MAG: hypothetical protein COC01_09470 [Bacteroidetes bacterium]|nr:MAG: hypothetical protein COC01_09470 [Bacteroidota bacterium]
MDVQADINWIMSELRTVKDPYLLGAFKNMLKYRRTRTDLPTSFFSTSAGDLKQRAEASLEAIERGETRSIEEFKKDVENWKDRQAM